MSATPDTPQAAFASATAGKAAAGTKGAGMAGGVPMGDPLRAVIIDILQGWGDLAEEDLKRLDMFRPEKILEVTDKIVLPKDHKTSEHATLRLGRIREHAAKLQAKSQPVAAAREPSLEAVAGLHVSSPAEETEPAKPEQPEEPVRLVPPMAEEPAPLRVMTPVETVSSWGAAGAWAAVTPAEAAGLWEPVTPSGATLPLETATASPAEAAAPAVEAVSEGAATAEAVSEGAASAEAVTVEEAAAEETEEWGVRAQEVPEETPPSAEQERVDREELPKTFWGAETATATAEADQRQESFSSLHVKIKSADDLMARPPAERADMLVFLEPDQLSRVFERTDDPELKKGVIDSLEHLGNTSALGALRLCLDDPDPEIQLYALEAADRLLGVD